MDTVQAEFQTDFRILNILARVVDKINNLHIYFVIIVNQGMIGY